MLKFLRKKIQSLSETQLNILTAILVLINLGIAIFWINFWISLPKTTLPPEEKSLEKEKLIEEIIEDLTAPEREEPISEEEKQKEKQRLEKVLESLTAPKK